MSTAMVSFQGVSKRFGRQQALKNLDLNVPEGCIYGLVGRNGAGKSTSLRLIMGLLQADSGEISILQHRGNPLPLSLRQQIGYSSDSLPLLPWLKVEQLLADNASFYPGWDWDYTRLWLQRLEIQTQKRIFSLSRGERQKLGFLMAIGHRPRLLILDEPAGGLDPVVRQQFLESLIELVNETGTTVLLSSHQLQELERIAEYVGLIDHGQLLLEGEMEQLRSRMRRVVLMGQNLPAEAPLAGALKTVSQPGYLSWICPNWEQAKQAALVQRFPQASLSVQPLNLEDIFLTLQGGPQHA